MTKLTAAEIRAAYPKPLSVRDRRRGAYCIGGAVLRYAHRQGLISLGEWSGLEISWPVPTVLALVLHRLNPKLTPKVALAAARIVITLNDAQDFELAWQVLDMALRAGESAGDLSTDILTLVRGWCEDGIEYWRAYRGRAIIHETT